MSAEEDVDDASSSTTAAGMMTVAAAPPSPVVVAAESSSTNIIGKVNRGHHLVHFDHYSKITKNTMNGEFQTSNTFAAAGHQWQIIYYPNGCDKPMRGHISVFLKHVGDVDDHGLRADVRISLVGKSAATAAPYMLGFRYTFVPDRSDGIGYPWFVTHEMMESTAPAFLKEDSFTIRCDIAVEMPPFVVDVPPSTLGWHLGDLLGDTESADVTVDVDGETFPAHRFVLAARSLVFKAQLFGPMKVGKGDVIRVNDVHADVFREFLHFIYTDELSAEGDVGDDGEEESIMAQHLLVAADKYDLPRLKVICENKLCKYLDVSTAATTLALAEQHSCHGLKKVVLEFLKVSSNMEAVKCTDGYKHLLESCPSLHEELRSCRILK